MTQLLTAATIDTPRGLNRPNESTQSEPLESLTDMRYNVRDYERGLNLDFMSYATYHLADMDAEALLNQETLFNHSQYAFETFFKHFVSQANWVDGKPVAFENISDSGIKTTEVTISTRIEILAMHNPATWLSVALLAVLSATVLGLVIALQFIYPPHLMLSDVKCLADTLLIVAGSDDLLAYAQRSDIHSLREGRLMTRLGWFKDRRGIIRWGVELVDPRGVEWVDGPTVQSECFRPCFC